jgi:hypothetical protein|tara:strand:+ start:308 stop:961 length:654 start_codon:yes stop_codon:yes gene_type:complete
MANLKHIGQVANTGLKCIVVFREIYDENGNVTEPDNCLIVETERLPDMEHDDMVRVVESPVAQEATEFYTVAHRSMFADGINMLVKLNNRGYLKKYPTDQILMTPNSHTSVKLSEINEVIRKQATGMSPQDIQNSMQDDTDKPPRTATSLSPSQTIDQALPTGEQAIDDSALAQTMLDQANTYETEVTRLREEAYAMAPDLKPKRGRPKKATADANT